MYIIAGHLQPLNVFMIYRTMFSDKDEATQFLSDELGAYTFFKVMNISQVSEHIIAYSDSTILVPTTPQKHIGEANEK